MAHNTVAVVPRDRFSATVRTIQSILRGTAKGFRLIVVEGGAPPRYRTAIERAVRGHKVEILRSDDFITANAAKNWVLREARDGEFLAFVENDNLVTPGWLERLIRACEEEEAEVARPMLFERKIIRVHPHFDQRLDRIEPIETPRGPGYRFRPRTAPLDADINSARRLSDVLETHCLLFRRPVFARIGAFDERITTRQEVDLALQLKAAGARIVFEPAAQVTYLRPPPVRPDERDYFLMRWDPEAAVRSHEIIREKWKVEGLPSSLQFVQHRRAYTSYSRYAVHYLRNEAGPYLRYDLGERLRYRAYRALALLPAPIREPAQRALYR
jgi:glycosyltransferase involved in cell wall biosynthesis